jgi:O-antigen/teichoic acid export membrane protein
MNLDRLILRLRDLVPSHKFLQSVAFLASGTILGQAANLLSIPILSRIFTKQDLGILGLVVSFTSIVSVVVTLKYELALVSAASEIEVRDLVLASIVYGFIFSALSCGFFFILHTLSLFGFNAVPVSFLPFIFLITLFVAYNGVFKYWFTRKEEFKIVGKINLFQNLAKSITQILLFPLGNLGLVIGETIGRSFGLFIGWSRSNVSTHLYHLARKKTNIHPTLKKYRKFSVFMVLSSFLDVLGLMLLLPIIASLYGVGAAGEFAMAQRVVAIPLALVGNSLADVFHSQVSNLQRNAPHLIANSFLNTTILLFSVGLIPTLTLGFFGSDIFRVVFGTEWQAAGKLVSVMTPWMLCQFMVSPVSRIILLSKHQHQKLIFDVLALACILAIPYWAKQDGVVLENLLWFLSLALVGAYAIYFGILYRLALMLSQKKD